ncbi:SDR family NAD(P)-dependent oxidoreductase [Rhizobium sp. BK399]|uniref:SDR family NAD(P)-dependent oxidoreductase n=1 Tax=Rhizobium sp. BK399 TaxID=2587063 RepID=UPI00178EAC93|nr:NAD(P)-dependent dehydrogenase (short-subunit alcohol dehydrogenase family) [Rhizobium sp. BK399]
MEIMQSLPDHYNALVIGASGGIGSALVDALENDTRIGSIVALSRSYDGIDITNEATIENWAARLKDREFHLLICATGALTIQGAGPEKSLKQLSPQSMANQFAVNAIGPALLLKHFAPLIPRRDRALICVLSARVGSIGDNYLGGWISYRASKAALHQIVRTASIEIGRTHPNAIVLAIHPGTVATTLSERFSSGYDRFSPPEAAQMILQTLDSASTISSGRFLAYDESEIVW